MTASPSMVTARLPTPVPLSEQDSCPVSEVFQRVGDRWSVLVLVLLNARPHRYNELHRAMEGLSRRMLTRTLRALERDGLLARTVFPTVPPGVEYALTPLGLGLLTALTAVSDWALGSAEQIQRHRAEYDAQS